MPRKQDLETGIRESYEIARSYEVILRTSDRPEERIRARHQVQAQRGLLQGYLAEYQSLVDDTLPDEFAQIAGYCASPSAFSLPLKIYHNLPQPDYGTFVGREVELEQIHRILRPYPHSQHAVVTIDGIGGIGKSTLALEVAHHYLRNQEHLPPEERFEAIIWTSAKASVLTADGIKPRQQIMRTLEDIYTTISVALEREDITRARAEEQAALVTKALTRQRTLLIIDNLETVDDERVNAFLRELPAPTKAIVTTRHRIDVAFPVRLSGMSQEDAFDLVDQECKKRGVVLAPSEVERLYRLTGGVPLAIVWSIARIGYGYETTSVLHSLGQPSSDIARFCFDVTVKSIDGTDAYKLLMGLALAASGADRKALGYIAQLSELGRDDGLVKLECLSLVNRQGERFSLLPLTRKFCLAEIDAIPDLKQRIILRWLDYLEALCQLPNREAYWGHSTRQFYTEIDTILEAILWAYEYGMAQNVFSLTLAADHYLYTVGGWTKDIELCDRALQLARSVQDSLAIARMAFAQSWIFRERGEYVEAELKDLEALGNYQENGNDQGKITALVLLSAIYRKAKRPEDARRSCDQAWKTAEMIGSNDAKILVKEEYGKLARAVGDWELAWDHFSAIRDWLEKRVEGVPSDERVARGVWGQLGLVAYHLGQFQEAKALCLKSLDAFGIYGTRSYANTLKYRLALAEEALGEYGKAYEHVEEAADWFDRLGMKPDYEEAVALLQRLEQRINEVDIS